MKTAFRLPVIAAIASLLVFSATGIHGAEKAAKTAGKYTFTSDWFTYHIPTWTRVLAEMKDKPNLTYLEIGSYEGRSFLWILDNILTHPTSRAVAIDAYNESVVQNAEEIFRENLRRGGHAKQVTVIKGLSQAELRKLPLSGFDLIYVDGDHQGKSVIVDTILSWDLLKDGGIMIFDDYKIDFDIPMELRPEYVLDFLQSIFKDEIQVLDDSYQLIIRKKKTPCRPDLGETKRLYLPLSCLRLGPYVYYFKPQKLFDAATRREIPLGRQEVAMMENILAHRRLGFRLEVKKEDTDAYRDLLRKLQIRDIAISAKDK